MINGLHVGSKLHFSLPAYRHVFLQMKDDDGSTSETFRLFDGLDGKGASGGRFPFVEIVIVVLGLNSNAVGDQVGGVETHTKLTDHGNVGASLQ